MMLYINLNDMIVKKAKNEVIAANSKAVTNSILLVILGGMIANGTIGIAFLGEMLVIGGANRATKWMIKNRKRFRR